MKKTFLILAAMLVALFLVSCSCDTGSGCDSDSTAVDSATVASDTSVVDTAKDSL